MAIEHAVNNHHWNYLLALDTDVAQPGPIEDGAPVAYRL
jgi:hypothetical protein